MSQPDELAALRAERDALERRAAEAEALAEELAEQLADAQRRLATSPAGEPATSGAAEDAHHLSLFDGAAPQRAGGRLAADGSDQAVLPLALAAVAVVAFLVWLLTMVTRGMSFVGLLVLLGGVALAVAAYRTRVVHRSAEVVDGVVEVVEGDTTRRFDLRNDGVKIDVQGEPGDAWWRVRFYRRALDPVDVDASMVDPEHFMADLRELRPDL